ncbi:cell wall-associated NlpC family hydrolase [Micromonospora purpureochromogenes]|uniref:Cell wall-associated NlpC family hydrolase n=1 Tax=Micromonospora purpureochromogenes TaxID=47872 RepID=A0ABX2RIS8_9ACTN|nr:cell wall-associated NlpC family hydrolase [Micromonospora purpureochromogenes]
MISPVLRPALWSALLGAVAAMALATPAYAEPALPNAVPDTGSRPVATGGLRLPGAAPGLPGGVTGLPTGGPTLPVGGVVASPLLAQITALETQNGQLGDQLLGIRQQRDDARTQVTAAEGELARARDALAAAQQRADSVAADAFKAAAALPPGEIAEDLEGLSRLSRISRGEQAEGATTAAAGELSRTRAAEQVATQAVASAQDRVRRAEEQFTAVEKALRENERKLVKLRADNQAQLIELERQQEAAEQKLGAAYVEGQSTTGLIASPQALAAVRYALAQLGDPYLWSAEGPDRFDCSGLMWAAYRSAGYYDLPRVSRDQYYATRARSVDRSALLPGDLLFFASGSSWTTIHHVGMYIGGGKMVQAPSTGDVVKISTVRWSGLYAATRVVGAVPAPATPPPPVTPTTPAPRPTGSTSPKPTTPAPKPSPTSTKVPTRPPTTPTTPPASPSPSQSPSPSPSPSDSGAPSPTTSSAEPSTAPSSLAPESSTSASTSTSASASTGA